MLFIIILGVTHKWYLLLWEKTSLPGQNEQLDLGDCILLKYRRRPFQMNNERLWKLED